MEEGDGEAAHASHLTHACDPRRARSAREGDPGAAAFSLSPHSSLPGSSGQSILQRREKFCTASGKWMAATRAAMTDNYVKRYIPIIWIPLTLATLALRSAGDDNAFCGCRTRSMEEGDGETGENARVKPSKLSAVLAIVMAVVVLGYQLYLAWVGAPSDLIIGGIGLALLVAGGVSVKEPRPRLLCAAWGVQLGATLLDLDIDLMNLRSSGSSMAGVAVIAVISLTGISLVVFGKSNAQSTSSL